MRIVRISELRLFELGFALIDFDVSRKSTQKQLDAGEHRESRGKAFEACPHLTGPHEKVQVRSNSMRMSIEEAQAKLLRRAQKHVAGKLKSSTLQQANEMAFAVVQSNEDTP